MITSCDITCNCFLFFFKQKTAYEMRISDWSSDVCSSDLILAFAIAGMVCACAALAYTELATMIPAAGSAYTFSYVALGETIAWVVGWSLILEYSLACSPVAVGWRSEERRVGKELGRKCRSRWSPYH